MIETSWVDNLEKKLRKEQNLHQQHPQYLRSGIMLISDRGTRLVPGKRIPLLDSYLNSDGIKELISTSQDIVGVPSSFVHAFLTYCRIDHPDILLDELPVIDVREVRRSCEFKVPKALPIFQKLTRLIIVLQEKPKRKTRRFVLRPSRATRKIAIDQKYTQLGAI
jgi:hypothetical protein